MDKELQTKLFTGFPKLFDLENKTNPISAWGIETPDGWDTLVSNLCAELQDYVNDSRCKQVKIAQLKSKFAGLRTYLYDVPSEVGYRGDLYNIVGKYQYLSYQTCEYCGTSNNKDKVTQNSDGWVLTLCDKCRKQKKELNDIRDAAEKRIEIWKTLDNNVQ